MIDKNELKSKFETSLIENIDRENAKKILAFLIDEKCNYIEDIIMDYLDLLSFEYNEFVKKYKILNDKYNNKFLQKAGEDMNLLEEFYA